MRNSLPGIGFIWASRRMHSSSLTSPFSPKKRLVATLKSRAAPSAWLDEVRSLSGQFGQVSALFSFSGGMGMISSCVTETAPWRKEVPMQSEPVSPPPITTTCLPSARIGSTSPSGSPETRRFCCGRKFMAIMHAAQIAALDGKVARMLGAAGEQHCVVVALELACRDVVADMDVAVEGHALGLHLLDAALDEVFLHLEIGDAVAEQAAGLGVLLIDMHVVAGAGELLRRGEPGGARADDRHALAGLGLRRLRPHPALGEGLVGDGAFDRFDGDGHVDDVERAGGLARRRADAARHLGEVVGGVEVAAPPPASRRDRRGRSSQGSGC